MTSSYCAKFEGSMAKFIFIFAHGTHLNQLDPLFSLESDIMDAHLHVFHTYSIYHAANKPCLLTKLCEQQFAVQMAPNEILYKRGCCASMVISSASVRFSSVFGTLFFAKQGLADARTRL